MVIQNNFISVDLIVFTPALLETLQRIFSNRVQNCIIFKNYFKIVKNYFKIYGKTDTKLVKIRKFTEKEGNFNIFQQQMIIGIPAGNEETGIPQTPGTNLTSISLS